MRPVITPEEAARLDAASEVSMDTLMDRAGFAVAVAAADMGAGYGTRTIVLCGPGNNGGDGYVAARYLARRGGHVEILATGTPEDPTSPAARAAAAARAAGISIHPVGEVRPADLVVDAIFGVGFHGDLPGYLLDWAEHEAPVLAVDLPSGVDGLSGEVGTTSFVAQRTVTFGALKTGHLLGEGRARSGQVEVVDIGLPEPRPALLLVEERDAPRPLRAADAHKWSAGSVAIIGGSRGLAGAPMLSARAALRFGAGAVRLIAPGAVQRTHAAMAPEIMTTPIGEGDRFEDGDAAAVLAAAERFDVLVLGPGLGEGRGKFVDDLMEQWHRPIVVDADALSVVDIEGLAGRVGPTVITPHAGEFRKMAGEAPSPVTARQLAERSACVVVAKGPATIVAGPAIPWAVATGTPALATIGTGDVLAGMIAALVARGLEPAVAARSGAYWHGRAGASLGPGLTADRLAEHVSEWAFP